MSVLVVNWYGIAQSAQQYEDGILSYICRRKAHDSRQNYHNTVIFVHEKR